LVKNPKELKMKITWNKNQFKSIGGFIGFSIWVEIHNISSNENLNIKKEGRRHEAVRKAGR
jgi:hypothetical protein